MEKVIIFGHGKYYRSKKENVENMYHIDAFIDNAVSPEDTQYDEGIPIYNPEHLKLLPSYPIIIMSVNFFEMVKQLFDLGVEESRIWLGMFIEPYYNDVEQLFDNLNVLLKLENKKFVLEYGEEKYKFSDEESYKALIRQLVRKNDPYIGLIADMPLKPVSRRWGLERGSAVDRYYIEQFLYENRHYITGDVMEIADNTYTYKYGQNIRHAYALHVNGWGKDVIKGNLETGEGIKENSVDCLICTQTLDAIFECDKVVKNIWRVLKAGGVALVTVNGIKNLSFYDYYNWGLFWSFTKQAITNLFGAVFEKDKMEVVSYGNVKTAVAMLYGVCQEDLAESDFIYNDEQFPLVVAAKLIK